MGYRLAPLPLTLGWPWTVLDPGHRHSASDMSNTTRDTMLTQWRSNRKPWIGFRLTPCMTFDTGWPWTVLVQGHQNCTPNIKKNDWQIQTTLDTLRVRLNAVLFYNYLSVCLTMCPCVYVYYVCPHISPLQTRTARLQMYVITIVCSALSECHLYVSPLKFTPRWMYITDIGVRNLAQAGQNDYQVLQ